eukprot:41826_1
MIIKKKKKKKNQYLNRLVLKHFNPQQNMDEMYALHLDGNRYNNTLGNLVWSERSNEYRNHRATNTTAVILQHLKHGVMHFKSQEECRMYLESINIKIAQSTMSNYVCQQKEYQGYSFKYLNESLYVNKVIDLDGEKWVSFHYSARAFNYFVSNFGRIKRITKFGKERLIKSSAVKGYQAFIVCVNEKRMAKYVHRTVGECFVPNPSNYSMLDHIDAETSNNHASNLRWIKDAKTNSNNSKTKKKMSESLKHKQKIKQIDKTTGDVICVWDRAYSI